MMPSSSGPGSPGSGSQSGAWPRKPRQKRSQVVRACDWCRKQRIKCDNNYPCSNCRGRNAQCSNEVMSATSMPVAQREIDRLRLRVRELELELSNERGGVVDSDRRVPLASSMSPPELCPSAITASEQGDAVHAGFWGGILMRTARSPHKTWYGPSSLFFFMGRINSFLSATALQQTHSADEMMLNSSSRQLDGPGTAPDVPTEQQVEDSSFANTPATKGTYLSPTQEEYFLDLYWQAYHTSVFAIIDETDFKAHYRSLWTASGNVRKPSALVDILVAMCMQYGMSMKKAPAVSSEDATIAGRWHYRRCQALLAHELESPTISTLQCHLLCCIYLCCGSFQNMADSACGLAVRTAYMLGLHLEPPQEMPRREREMRKRLWWALYVLDSKIGMKLGRPFLLPHASSGTVDLPGDDLEVAMHSGSDFSPLGNNVTWLSFNRQQSQLFHVARTVHTAFYRHGLHIQHGQTMWDDEQALARQAEFIRPYMDTMDEWVKGVPGALRTKRQGNGQPFSTDRSSLDIEEFSPLWLQRQRLLLELMYHHLCVNLSRPFICLGAGSTATEEPAKICVFHASALTTIMHQVMSSTSILSGWHEAFQLQWNAAITLVGFALAYPHGSLTADVRKTLDLSVAVFDIFGRSFAVAISAARIIKDLGVKVDYFMQQNAEQQGAVDQPVPAVNSSVMGRDFSMPDFATMYKTWDGALSFDELNAASMQDVFNMAFSVDEWSDMASLWPSMDGTVVPEQCSYAAA